MVVVNPEIVARTERLFLRPLVAEDAADVLLMRKHEEVMKHTYVFLIKFKGLFSKRFNFLNSR